MVEGDDRQHHGTRIVRSPPAESASRQSAGPTPQGEHAPAEGDRGTYQGSGFTGRRLGERGTHASRSPRQSEPEEPVQPQSNAPHMTPPTMHCLSCNTQAQWLPNGQLWCPACQTALEVEDRTKQAGAAVGGVIVGIAMLLFALGAFDPILAQYFGFSVHECIGTYNFAGQMIGVDCSGPLGWSTGVTQP